MSYIVRKGKDGLLDAERFQGAGVTFRGKLIGIDDVPEARGDKMCQESLQKLKAIIKASNAHKQRILINISLEGIKIMDQINLLSKHSHPVHRISFIARDVTDSRAMGYIYGPGDGTHKFYAIKTEKAAEPVILTLRDLFQVVFEMKTKEMEEKKQEEEAGKEGGTTGEENVYQVPQNNASVDEPDATYQVPTNNSPVQSNQPSSNLVDLEGELASLQQGIQQIKTLEDAWGSTLAAPLPKSDSKSSIDDLEALAFSQTPQNAFSSGFGSSGLEGLNLGAPAGNLFGAPQPNLFGPGASQPGFGAGFGQPSFGAPQPAFGMPAQPGLGFPGPPRPGSFGPPVQPGFGAANPFGTPGRLGQPMVRPAFGVGPFGAPAGNPFPGGPGQDFFPSSGPAALDDPNILQPIKPPEPEVKEDKLKRIDPFSDLVNIGGTPKTRTPKDLFADQTAPSRKSLNTLKVEGAVQAVRSTSPSPTGIPLMPPPAVPPQQKKNSPFDDFFGDSFAPMSSSNDNPFGN